MTGLIEHLESFLGRIEYGWKDSDGTAWPFQVVKFSGGAIAEASSYSTLGLSNRGLLAPISGKTIRHELIFLTRASLCCAFAWLVPITSHEARMAKDKGWDQFEDLLTECDPALLDMERASIVS